VNDPKSKKPEPPPEARRSPIRPTAPIPPTPPPASVPPTPAPPPEAESPSTPNNALNALRQKMEAVADEFAQGKINRAQFNALYKRYSEQRTIIERLLERNPDSEAWKQVIGVKGQTGFLRHHFEAQTLYFTVYHRSSPQPIMVGGKQPPENHLITPLLKSVWLLKDRPKLALGRRQIGETNWLLLAVGDYAATAVMFSLEPSNAQARLVRDLHADFERANQAALTRGWIVPERMVFPQRALVEGGL
jgi:seryl-tRNA synthetase